MPVEYCQTCNKLIDLDTDVEHFADHMANEEDNGEDQNEDSVFEQIDYNDEMLDSIESAMMGD